MNIIHNAIKLATIANHSIKDGTSIKESLHSNEVGNILTDLKASEETICAGICHNLLNNNLVSQEEIRKATSAVSVYIINLNNTLTMANFNEFPIENKLLAFADNLSNTRIIIDEKNKGNKLWDEIKVDKDKLLEYYKKLLELFKKIPEQELEKIGIDIKKFEEFIKEFEDNIEKIREITMEKDIQEKVYSPSEIDYIKNGRDWEAYDKEGNFLGTGRTKEEIKRDLNLINLGYDR